MTNRCDNCKFWNHDEQFSSAYDGKNRAVCSEQNNATRGHELCSQYEANK